jgi:hypothetical protein
MDCVMSDTPLTLAMIADLLQVGFWRVRQWHARAKEDSPGRRRLCTPDVSSHARYPLWSRGAVIVWATGEGLWPPGVDMRTCAECGDRFAIYESGTIRNHHDGRRRGEQIRCVGSNTMPREDLAAAV